jgi:integrase/recombinase XerD
VASVAAAVVSNLRNVPVAPNRGRKFPAEPLTPGEVQALLGACSHRSASGIRNRALITLLYRSGLRITELLALRPSDVNLDKHSIRLAHTKSGEAQTRGFHPSADDALMRWYDCRQGVGRDSRLFCTLVGGRLSADYVRGMLHRLARQAGIDKRVAPHQLRHTFAMELEQAGTPVTVTSKLLGHKSIAVTAAYLDHLTNAAAVTALACVELPELSC